MTPVNAESVPISFPSSRLGTQFFEAPRRIVAWDVRYRAPRSCPSGNPVPKEVALLSAPAWDTTGS
jgi:hypothetical protein